MLNVIMLNVIMLNVIMLNVIMLIVVMLSVVMLSVVMLIVVMLSVVAPSMADNSRFETQDRFFFIGILQKIIFLVVKMIVRTAKQKWLGSNPGAQL